MRIGGMASGMDTEQMVRDLMKAERVRVNKFLRQEQTLKWRQEAYNDVNRVMANFILSTRRDLGLTQIGVTGTISKTVTNNLNWIKEASSSNDAVVMANARGNAMNGNHTVEVTQMAENATVSSRNITNLLDENLKFKVSGTLRVETHIGFADIEVDTDMTINDFVSKVNNAVATEGDNKDKNLGLRAAFDRQIGQFMITTRETGKDKLIRISQAEVGQPLMNDLFNGDDIVKLQKPKEDTTGINGKNAVINFNGTEVEKNTNNFTVYGIELNLKSVAIATPVNIKVDTNVNSIYNKIKSFVDSYNEMLGNLNGKVNEKEYRSFHPLVKDEKEAMTEKDIELWEEKAKSGLLRNDDVIARSFQTIRGNLYLPIDKVAGTFKHLTDIGITTGNYRDGGKLVINEEKLKEAIGNDPEGVMDLFFKAPDSGLTGKERTNESGIIQRIFDGLVTGMKDIIRRSGTGEDASLLRNVQGNILMDFVTKHSSISVLDKDLSGINSRIAREEVMLNQREDRYWRQFSAMEKALSQMQQQSTWLMSQMGFGQ